MNIRPILDKLKDSKDNSRVPVMEAEVAIVKQVASLRNSLIDGIKERADTGDGYCSM